MSMSKAGNISNCIADASVQIDMVQFYIGKLDSDDDQTCAGAAGVDEDIIAELKKRGNVERKQLDPMIAGIHNLNRGAVIGNSINIDPMVENIVKLSFSWKECEHALCIAVAPGDHESEDAYRIWCE